MNTVDIRVESSDDLVQYSQWFQMTDAPSFVEVVDWGGMDGGTEYSNDESRMRCWRPNTPVDKIRRLNGEAM